MPVPTDWQEVGTNPGANHLRNPDFSVQDYLGRKVQTIGSEEPEENILKVLWALITDPMYREATLIGFNVRFKDAKQKIWGLVGGLLAATATIALLYLGYGQ